MDSRPNPTNDLEAASNNRQQSKVDIYSRCSFYKPFASMARPHGSTDFLTQTESHRVLFSNDEKLSKSCELMNITETAETKETEKSDKKTSEATETASNPPVSSNKNEPTEQNLLKNTHRKSIFAGSIDEFNRRIRNENGSQKKAHDRIPTSLRKRPSCKQTNLDHILHVIGSFGFYQKLQFMLVGFLAILPAMVAYSYVFVSATPRFTCSVVREIQLTIYDTPDMKKKHPLESVLSQEELSDDEDDPFEFLKMKKLEYFVETRRYIRLFDDEDLKNTSRIKFDNNCVINQDMILKKFKSSTPPATVQKGGRKMATTTPVPGFFTAAGTKRSKKTNLQCVEWVYDDTFYGKTTVTSWNLVCLKSHLKATTQNAFILGKVQLTFVP
jgi:hypothetical protein